MFFPILEEKYILTSFEVTPSKAVFRAFYPRQASRIQHHRLQYICGYWNVIVRFGPEPGEDEITGLLAVIMGGGGDP